MATQVAKVTVDSTQVASDLVNFPVYTRLADMPTDFWSGITTNNVYGDASVYWKLEDTSAEIGGKTLTNNGSVTFTSGKFSNAATFSNSTSQSLTASSIAFETAGSFSFWTFINTGDNGGYFTDATNGNRYYFYYGSGGSWGLSLNGTTQLTGSTSDIPFNQWNHIVVNWDTSLGSDNIEVFVNGSSVATQTTSISASTPATFYIGNRYSNTGTQDSMNGKIDDFAILNRTLTSGEISAIYNSGTGNEVTKIVTGGDIRVYKNNATQTVNTNVLDLESSSSEYATISDASQTGLDFGTGAFSLEAWVKLESTGSFKAIVSKRTGDTDGYSLYINSSDQIIFDCIASSSIDTVTGSTSLSAGVWYHVAGVRDGSNLLVYINGVQDGSGTDNSRNVSTSVNFHIGALRSTPDNYFDGEIADVRAWSDARTPAEIAEYYNQQLAGTETNLVGYWKFDSSLLDETSNNNDLTHSGTATYVADPPYTKAGELPREVVSCDTTGETGELHVLYQGTLSSSTDTQIDIYADGTSADYAVTDTYGRNAVWTGYAMVSHNGGETESSGGNGGTANGNLPTSVTGKIGTANDFDGTGDYFSSISTSINPSTDDYTITAWVESDVTSGSSDIKSIFTFYTDDNNFANYFLGPFATDTLNQTFQVRNSGTFSSEVSSTSQLSINTYAHTATYVNGTAVSFYLNGSTDGGGTLDIASTTTSGNSQIGINTAGFEFDGEIDEIRVYDGQLSADWISAEYTNQNTPTTFYTAAAPVTYSLDIDSATVNTSGQAISLEYNYQITINTAAINTAGQDITLLPYLLAVDSAAVNTAGQAITLQRGYVVDVDTASIVTTPTDIGLLFTGWTARTKNTASFTEKTKNSAVWTERTKN